MSPIIQQQQHSLAPAGAGMPKKRQQGFNINSSDPFAQRCDSGQPIHQATSNVSNSSSVAFGQLGLASSFIDTDILLSDDLWAQLSEGRDMMTDQQPAIQSHSFSPHLHSDAESLIHEDVRQKEESRPEGHIVIPHSGSYDMFPKQSVTFGSFQKYISGLANNHGSSAQSVLSSRDSVSMEEVDSPEGSNGDSASTFATSILSPSSFGTHAGSLPKASQARHNRSTSTASSQPRKKAGRSLSRSRTKALSPDKPRKAERSPSQDRGGVGKAPSGRSRPSRRATIGPAAQAAAQVAINGHLRVDASGAAAAVGPIPNKETRSPLSALAGGAGGNGNNPWSMFGQMEQMNGGSSQTGSDPHCLLASQELKGVHWPQAMRNPQSTEVGGLGFSSSSLPTPLSFQTSMQHLHLQTPPLQQPGQQAHPKSISDGGPHQPVQSQAQAFNPFLFPPYSQHGGDSGASSGALGKLGELPEGFCLDSLLREGSAPDSVTSAQQGTPNRSDEVSEGHGAKESGDDTDAPASKGRRMSKSASGSQRGRALEDVAESEDGQGEQAMVSKGKVAVTEEDEDGIDEEEDDAAGASSSKSEAEAKRLADKRRRRRESHNAVERRRRDNINEKITELATLLPEAMLLDAIATSTQGGNSGTFAPAIAAKAAVAAAAAAAAASGSSPSETAASANDENQMPKSSAAAYAAALAPVQANSAALAAAQAKPNKGIILRKSVEYIRHLQQFLDMQMSRNSYLENELQRCRAAAACGNQAIPGDHRGAIGEIAGGFVPAGHFYTPGASGFFGPAPAQGDLGSLNFLDLGLSDSPGQSERDSSHKMSERDEGPPASLAAWLGGYDQRTGLPRRSSVEPIEEEDGRSLERLDDHPNGAQVGQSGEDVGRGRSRQREGRQRGSWPRLKSSGAPSPLRHSHESPDMARAQDNTQTGDIKMENS
ncbi:hypothetical protein IE53DRAFT_152634 [Violaceomyces palustris]|uniref:Uncharacterized protein n=1 Tax=Violaceomyces palustris TaxID=1673888 RepID=A0ACD0NU00_9BASI|nr:hypothetical protein IE53DRAFT_152634 [Violaceomyces palustris]